MVFKIVVHPEPTGGYRGEVPSLPGCYSQSESIEELETNLREAISGYLEGLRAEGRLPDREVQVLELVV